MDFSLTEDQQMMVNTAEQIAEKFGPEYWREKDEAEEYPADFLEEIGNQGFFGLPAPEQFGGLNLGLTEVAVVMEALCRGGGGGEGNSGRGGTATAWLGQAIFPQQEAVLLV